MMRRLGVRAAGVAGAALLATLAGCATSRSTPVRAALLAEATADDVAILETPDDDERASQPAGSLPQEKRASTDTRTDDVRWDRRPEEQELAVMRKQMTAANQPHWEDYQRRRTSVTAFMSLNTTADSDATSGLPSNFEWKGIVEEGVGAGLEIGHDVVPAFEIFAGAKYDNWRGDEKIVATSPSIVTTKTTGLDAFPFYVGGRLNFPLAIPFSDWFSTSQAGLSYGVIPFVKGQVGGVFVDGMEVSIRDQLAGGPPFEYDLIDRGFHTYAGVEVGIEYRTRSGFALKLSVGAERYFGLDLASEAENILRPGAEMNDLRQALLPRLSATVYF